MKFGLWKAVELFFFFFFLEHVFTISRLVLFEEWVTLDKENRNSGLFGFLLTKCNISGITEDSSRSLKKTISGFTSILEKKWYSHKKCRVVFLAKNEEWMSKDFTFKVSLHHYSHTQPSTSTAPSTSGRPCKEFED